MMLVGSLLNACQQLRRLVRTTQGFDAGQPETDTHRRAQERILVKRTRITDWNNISRLLVKRGLITTGLVSKRGDGLCLF